jgi:membrane-bound ClpP family serine protease
MINFLKITEYALTYIAAILSVVAFIVALLFGAYWHIATGTICLILFIAQRNELKKNYDDDL